MAEKIRICCEDKLYIKGFAFEKKDFSPLCELEKMMPDNAYIHTLDENAKIFAVKARIGKDPHPFTLLCEAARYIEGAWIVGIDEAQNRYFTPLFTNLQENS